jgi:serine/threonine protein kinase
MPATPAIGGPSEMHLRQACADLDVRLRAGEVCRTEQVLATQPLFASQEDWAVELIYTEFVAREELGQRPTPEEFYARFPHWRDRLQRQFQIHELLRDQLHAETRPAAAPEPLTGRLGQYDLIEPLARGGCGVIYRAWQSGLERVVALKVLRPELSRVPRARQRFCHEARVMAGLRHPHIMPIHEIGECRGAIFFSMDFAAGGSLAERTSAWEPREAARLLAVVARAMHFAHQQGVVHCDLKPSNILLDERGEPLLSDFGLARLPTSDTDLDGPGQIIGTPAYMAPEQIDAETDDRIGPATDVWALGVILHEMLTGTRPFRANTLADLQQIIGSTERLHLAAVPAPLARICSRCLAKGPGDRYPSAGQLAGDLQSCSDS